MVLEDSRLEGGIVVNEIRINDSVVMLPQDSQIDIHAEPNDGVRLTLTVFPTSITVRPKPEE